MVVNAAALGAASSVALVEVKLAALGDGTLHLGTVDGPLMTQRELPYALPSDATLPA